MFEKEFIFLFLKPRVGETTIKLDGYNFGGLHEFI